MLFKSLKSAVIATALGLGLSFGASALVVDASDWDLTGDPATPINPSGSGNTTSGVFLVAYGDQTGQAAINLIIDSIVTLPEDYKFDLDGAVESGAFAGSYSSAIGADGGTITYDLGTDVLLADHILVKDGNNDPAWYLFDISDWDGMETITLENFWVGNGSISHVSLYGEPCGDDCEPPTCEELGNCPPPPCDQTPEGCPVPEPAPLGMLGLGLLGLYAVRRKYSVR